MKTIYACLEHIEEALDDAVYGGFYLPVMEQFKAVGNKIIKCDYCECQPIYVVVNKCAPTKS